VSHCKKFLPSSGAIVLCCLALTTALAFAQDAVTKTTVTYPSAHATSKLCASCRSTYWAWAM
jgi:hypothetical protein